MKKITLCLAVTAGLLLGSCKKNDNPVVAPPKVTTGLYVLSEGNFGQNNTTLTFYDFTTKTATTDFYATVNGNKLGDTGNDLLVYGSKLYIVMNVSSYVQVAEAATGRAITKLPFTKPSGGLKQPRFVVGYKNKVLVSAYDGTVTVIDTTSLTAEKTIQVGANPEQMAIYGDKLFVANSGGLQTVFDSTLSVIDLNSFTEKKKITVGLNPGSVTADDAGNIYVSCTGDYGSTKPKLVKVNASTESVTTSADSAVGRIRYFNGLLYATGGYLGSPNLRTLSPTDFKQTGANFITDGSVIKQAYGFIIDPDSGDVYITDAVDYSSPGIVYSFDKAGKKKFSFSVTPGISPNSIALIKK